MDEFREVKPELIDESEDVRNQNLNDALEDIPNYTTMGRLKRKMTDSNVSSLEKEPKLEPLDERVNSSLAPKLEPFMEDQFKEEEEPIEEGYYELESDRNPKNTVPFPRYTIWDQRDPSLEGMEVKEEPLDAPTGNQDFEYESSCNPVKKEEEPDYAYEAYETSDYQLEEPKVEEQPCQSGSHGHPLPKYTIIWNQSASSTGERMWEKVLNEQPRSSLAPIKQKVYKLPTPEDVRVDVELPGGRRETLYCCLCGALKNPQLSLIKVHFKSELLILAVGLGIAGKLTVEKGQELMARTQSTYACQWHYWKAAERIQEALDSRPVLEVVVQGICPQMTMERFRVRFGEFHKKHHQLKKETNSNAHCELCNLHQPYQDLVDVNHQGTKHLLALCSVLQGYRNPNQAAIFVHEKSTRKVCPTHHELTFHVILSRLNIQSVDEQPGASNLLNLMVVVTQIWPKCTPTLFWQTFEWFAREQQAVGPLMTPPTRIRQPTSTGSLGRQLRVPILRPPPKPKPTCPLLPKCSLCLHDTSTFKKVKEKNTKLVLVIGAFLSNQMELWVAKKFMAGKATKLVCTEHFESSIRRILEHLQIQFLSQTPALELALHVTGLVQAICSTNSILYGDFITMVTVFAQEYLPC